MSPLRVNTELMASGASKIQNALDDIDNVLGLLNQDVNAMLSAWSGDAASAHTKLHERFGQDAAVIRNSLGEMRASLLRTHAVYVAQESQQTSDQNTMSAQIMS